MGGARPVDYAGAIGRVALRDIPSLGNGWVVQPKMDGAYARLTLDSRGRVSSVISRAGRSLSEGADLLGAFVGWPHSVLIGELEACTESGVAAARRGWRLCHLFDCVRAGNRYLAREPYRARRDALYRMQSEVVNLAPPAPWERDSQGDAHDPVTGRYRQATAHDWRLTPIVPQMAPSRVRDAFDEWVAPGGEGLVAVNLNATLGARGAKLKCKSLHSVEAFVTAYDGTNALVSMHGRPVAVYSPDRRSIGEVVEIAYEGFYRSGTPKFPRILRSRPDLLS